MRRVGLILAVLFFLLALISIAVWPSAGPKVKLSVAPLGPSAQDSAKFTAGITNNSQRSREVLAARGVPTDRGLVMADDQEVLGPRSGTLVPIQVPGGTSSWTLIVSHRGHDGRVEATLRSVGWRLRLLRSPYSPEFAQWKEIRVDIPR